MACCAGIGRWWDSGTGVDEMVDWDFIVIFWRNVFVSPLGIPIEAPPPFPKYHLSPRTIAVTNPLSRYVAMHTMQEDDNVNTQSLAPDENQSNGYLDAGMGSRSQSRRPGKEGRSASLVFAAVGGMLLPLLTQVGHAH